MDNLYYESDEEGIEVEGDFPVDYDLDEFGETQSAPEKNYTFLSEEEIAKLEEDYIREVSTVLSISESDACLLLPHFHWRFEDLQDEWFADEDKVRDRAGLLKKPVVQHSAGQNLKVTCGICFDDFNFSSESPISTILTASCGHPYCRACWAGYIGTRINEGGPACLMLRCPEPKCNAAIGPDLIHHVLVMSEKKEKALYDKYERYLLRSYVENHKKIKWCPAPNCDYAVQFDSLGEMASYDVSCVCSHTYCWNCTDESHRPVDCKNVKNWHLKNKDDSQNGKWIMVNTKPCPKCKRSIEKNRGCNHMTCSPPCRHHFCWYCLGPFNSGCGCNGFARISADKSDEGNWGGAEVDRRKAKRELERYVHYYERWENNGRSKQKAIEDFEKVKASHIKELGTLQKNTVEHEYDFIETKSSMCSGAVPKRTKAWQQIIECRQVLRWTFVYGYYMSEKEEHGKREFFECLQGAAEHSLEQLHDCAERELQPFLVVTSDIQDSKFMDFKKKLTGLTKVTGNYFNKLASALEEGLSEIKISSEASETKSTEGRKRSFFQYESASSSSSTRHTYQDDSWSCQRCSYINPATSRRCQICSPDWFCVRCTYSNPASADRCQMCSVADGI